MALKHLLVICGFLALGSYVSSEACTLDQQTFMKFSGECVASVFAAEPMKMFQIMERMKNPQSLTGFLCNNIEESAAVLVCLENKLSQCLPEEHRDLLAQVLPSQDRLVDAMRLMCNNQEALNDHCLEPQMMEITNCYVTELTSLKASFMQVTKKDVHEMMCQVIGAEESCITKYQRGCSKDYLKLMFEILDKIFPLSNCPSDAFETKNGIKHRTPYKLDGNSIKNIPEIKNGILSHLLLHGAPIQLGEKPLKYIPEVNYN